MRVLLRYWLLQIPGILLVSVALLLLWRNEIVGTATASAALALWLLKDLALYPLYRFALRPPAPTGAQALVGQLATARTEIAERGIVRIGGELWQARTRDGTGVRAGARVEVVAAHGLWLTVEPAMPRLHRQITR